MCRFILLMGVAAQDLGISVSAYEQDHNILILLGVMMSALVPFILGLLFGSPIADRIPRRKVLMVAFGVQFAQDVLLTYLSSRGSIILPVMYVMLVFSNLIGGAGTSAQGAIVQDMFSSASQQNGMLRNARFYSVFAVQVSRVGGNLLLGVMSTTMLFAFSAIGCLPMLFYLSLLKDERSVPLTSVRLRMNVGHLVRRRGTQLMSLSKIYRGIWNHLKGTWLSLWAAWKYLKDAPKAHRAFRWALLINIASANNQVFAPAVGLSVFGGKIALSHLMAAYAVGGIIGCLLGIWNTRKGGTESSIRLLLAWGLLLIGSYTVFEFSSKLVYAMVFFAIASFATAGVNNTSNSLITSIKGEMGEERPEMFSRLQLFYTLTYCLGAVVFCAVTCVIYMLTGDLRWAGAWSLVGWLVIAIGLGRRLIRGR